MTLADNKNNNEFLVFLLGREFLLHPSSDLSKFYTFIDGGNINIFINTIAYNFKIKKLYKIFNNKDVIIMNNNKLLNLRSDINFFRKNPFSLQMAAAVITINNNNNDDIPSFLLEKINYYNDLYMTLQNIRVLSFTKIEF